MTIIPVILSGGSGTRLWPLSRAAFPKQFISLCSENSMLQDTLQRFSDLKIESPIIVSNEAHRFVIADQLLQIGIENPAIILEPLAKNTAPAIAAAAFKSLTVDKDAIMVVLPSDHKIKNTKAFQEGIKKAVKEASNGALVTFGIMPTFAATGYGYIEAGEKNPDTDIFAIKRFVEKPNQETAQSYIELGNFFWNSGMFVFKAAAFLEEIKLFNEEIYEATEESFRNAKLDLDFIRLDKVAFEKNTSISIDYAVMEKTSKGKVIPLDAGWSDVGSWSSLWDASDKDSDGNVIKGKAITKDLKNSFVYTKNKTVSAVGLENVVIVDTNDALLVSDMSKSEDVKKIVDKLKADNNSIATENLVNYKPWGNYETLDEGNRYIVHRVTLKPGQRQSLHVHYHRAEHWVIVSGTAKIINGDKELVLTENESTFIPLGTLHCLENPGRIPLEVIEVQSGTYLEEDDIVRTEDRYGRTE